MKITVLIENNVGNKNNLNLNAEHGLSLFIESDAATILLDAGKTGKILENAKMLNVDLTKTDFAVLSHGHYDHADGFLEVLKQNPLLSIYSSQHVMGNYYSMREGTRRYIGLNNELKEKYRNSFHLLEKSSKIVPNVYLLLHERRDYSEMAKRACLYAEEQNELIYDRFLHEMTLVIREKDGLYAFNSCSHVGVEQIIDEIEKEFPQEHIVFFAGGFHFLGKEPGKCSFTKEQVSSLGRRLDESRIERVYTGHCTGEEGFNWLKEEMRNSIREMHTGDVIE